MDIDMKAMKAEIGGAFVLTWVVFGMGLGTLSGAVALAVTWMAFSGAHLLPVVTWSHIMTGDLSDTEGNWMANGMRLVAQVVGAALAVVLMTEAGAVGDGFTSTDMWIPDIADTAVNWICDCLFVGIGAFLGCQIDGMLGEEE